MTGLRIELPLVDVLESRSVRLQDSIRRRCMAVKGILQEMQRFCDGLAKNEAERRLTGVGPAVCAKNQSHRL